MFMMSESEYQRCEKALAVVEGLASMSASVVGEISEYIEELKSIVSECDRPQPDDEKCIQCREKERVIERLERILKA